MLGTSARFLAALICLSAMMQAQDNPTLSSPEARREDRGARAGVWLDVPFVPQEREGCGAAAIAMVMQYWQQRSQKAPEPVADPSEIQRVLYSKDAHGIYASAIEHYLDQRGFQTFAFRGTWDDLKQHLEKGRPLIVALRPTGSSPLHYVVVAGVNWERDLVLVNDPAQKKLLKQDRSSFEREWNAAEKWTLLAVPQSGAH
jgi:ABC-type bacteriocin/lantibiotic exporter with double-glycine peptidase domain